MYGSMPLIMNPPTYSTKKNSHTSPEDWAFHSTTGLCTRRLGFSPDYWALHPTAGLCTRLLGCNRGGQINPGNRSVQVNLVRPFFFCLKYLFFTGQDTPILAQSVPSGEMPPG